ncbi:hypothetical protein ACI2S5_06660 [Ralstonia nicotianae]|uniref:hypothetical protein n=1 Tax=Ralstonia pseudosolanacearum TaxID=1310165 RepID=UPI0007F14684|nr:MULTISPECIES: hypothetical protein [Ralstonia]ANH32695.1 hypothetical protein A3768_1539 [Ralstonia solanacearum]MDO3517646.1 hypothetical protein [Ralstonia pseudosolanacearum]MDO3540311.1 hypothetical protein [Ralstonia pseudosolanacearum]QKL51733.1 hypothetical protein HI816_07550 [Ralstonia solanacearum]QKM22988.1 hypothetical protein HI796_07545 [Ralstonia solanacearum]
MPLIDGHSGTYDYVVSMMVSNGRGTMACIGRGRPCVVRASNPLFARAPAFRRKWEHRHGWPSQHPSHAGMRRFGIHLASGIAETAEPLRPHADRRRVISMIGARRR